jgi:uroporphyrinogen decarboxylase
VPKEFRRMTGKDRVLAAIRRQPTDRVPWVPFVGCHAASLLGLSAEEYLKSADRIVEGVSKAVETYEPDGIPVMFDLQVEAEALGCELAWADENPPAVITHPLANGTALSDLSVPSLSAGRIATALAAAARLRKAHADIALYGLVTGPFTLALHLLGTDIFMKMFDEPDEVRRLLDFCMGVTDSMADAYARAGCDVIAVVDPMTSQIGPDQFRQFVTPCVEPVFARLRERGVAGSFFVCGHAQQNVEAMCDCGPDNVSVDENIPLDYVRDVCLARGVSFGGNMQLTTVLLLGSAADAQRNAVECMETAGADGYVLSPGCDLPYAVPCENLRAVGEVVRDPYKAQVARAMAKDESACDLLDMSEYGQSGRVIVDIITLDSEACAPCQYMVEAVKRIAPEFRDVVEWREHKIKYRESLVFMTSLMVRNVPTICIDGQITFVSRIPSKDELIQAINKRIYEKLRIRIQSSRGALIVLGQTDEQCSDPAERCRQAVTELGSDIEVRTVTDEREIASYGLGPSDLPAVLVSRHKVKSTRHAPDLAIVKEWIKDI